MKDQWLKDIHDRMSDFETEEPDGLWEAIGSARARQENLRRRTTARVWMRRCAGIAAMIAIAVTVYMWHPVREGIQPEETTAETPHFVSETVSSNRDVSPAVITSPDKRMPYTPKIVSPSTMLSEIADGNDATAYRRETNTTDSCVTAPADMEAGHSPAASEEADSIVRQADRNDICTARKKTSGQYYYAKAFTRRPGNGHSHVSIGVFTSGGVDMTKHNASPTYAADNVAGTDGMAWKDSPMLGILLFNKGREVVTEMKHRLPIRTGATVAYRLNDRVALESGIVYTNLTSDMKYGGAENYMSGRQKLHYIGIPLNVKYRAMSWKRLDVYGSAGVMAEKCVSGKIEKDYFFDSSNRRKETEDAKVKTLQWSVNVSAGLQLNVSNLISLYAEPGASYHIDNGSPVKTIYNDKPLNFNLNLGLRLNVGK